MLANWWDRDGQETIFLVTNFELRETAYIETQLKSISLLSVYSITYNMLPFTLQGLFSSSCY